LCALAAITDALSCGDHAEIQVKLLSGPMTADQLSQTLFVVKDLAMSWGTTGLSDLTAADRLELSIVGT
jgi:hypothetical protein